MQLSIISAVTNTMKWKAKIDKKRENQWHELNVLPSIDAILLSVTNLVDYLVS